MQLTVSFACNNEVGNFNGRVDKIDISIDPAEMAMEIEAPMDQEEDENGNRGDNYSIITMDVRREPGQWRIRLGNPDVPEADQFFEMLLVTYGEYYGSIAWNAGDTEARDVCRLLTWMQKTGGWTCECAWTDLTDKFETCNPITPEDFGAPP